MTERTWKELLAGGWQGGEGQTGEEADRLVEHAAEAMRRRFGADRKRVCHALRVLRLTDALLAGTAGQLTEGQALSARLCAVLHDIGIQQAERLHGSAAARFQELEGPPIARDILRALDVSDAFVERVCHIVGHHHTADAVDGPDFQLLWEADLLVNLMEDGARDSAALRSALKRNLLSPGSAVLALECLGIDLSRADL